jgi:putative peptidoglycan lipid II flippase
MNPTAATPKKKRPSLGSVAFLLVGTSLVGQMLGFLRTKLVNANFPPIGPHSTDAYFAAFNIPDFFFFTLSAGALGVALMPVLSDRLHKSDKRAVWELATSLLNFLAMIMSGVAVFILIFAKPLISHVVAPHMPPEQLDTAANIMRLLAFNPLLFTISGILTSVQQTMGRFFVYAIAPLVYNLSIIVSIYVFKHNIGLVGLGIGALIGAILQLLVVMLGLSKLNFHWHPHIMWRSSDFHTVLRNLPPRSLDQGVDQIGDIVNTNIASGLGSGSITYYNNAYILSTAPILLIGTAISTAAFPRLNARLSQGRPDLFRRDFLKILRLLVWLAAPVVVIGFFCRGYLSRLIYTSGNEQIAVIFGFMSLAIFARIIYTILSRWFYSQKDTRTPLVVSLFTIAFNISLSIFLTRPGGYGVAGLAIAQSIVASAEVMALFTIMVIRDHKLLDAEFLSAIWRIVSVTGFSVVAGFIMISLYPLGASDRGIITLGSKLGLITLVVFGVHIAVSAVFSLEEVNPIFARAKKIFYKPIDIEI